MISFLFIVLNLVVKTLLIVWSDTVLLSKIGCELPVNICYQMASWHLIDDVRSFVQSQRCQNNSLCERSRQLLDWPPVNLSWHIHQNRPRTKISIKETLIQINIDILSGPVKRSTLLQTVNVKLKLAKILSIRRQFHSKQTSSIVL